jgi:DNA primase
LFLPAKVGPPRRRTSSRGEAVFVALTTIGKDELRERLDVLDIIGQYVRLNRAGNEYRGLCPFHEEKTPSFYVNPQKGLWFCRGACSAGGDVFDFVMRAEKLEFREAAELLANRLGLTLAVSERDTRRSDERERIFNLNGLATRLFERVLWAEEVGRAAREYLLGRGLTEETLRRFRLGYAPPGWDNLSRHLERGGVSLADAELAGLVRRRERGGGYYDRFRHRVMFPILDSQDRTLGFGGRILDPNDQPKYLNTAENAVFSKGTILYGLPFAVSHLAEGAVVVEGYMDVIALHQHGVEAAMATLGTALTAGHLKLLRRHTDRVILCYDADSAGRHATDRAAVLFIDEGLDGRVLTLPAGQDPDEFIGAEGREAFLERVKAAPDLIEYRLSTAFATAGSDPAQRLAAIEQAVVPVLAEIRDEPARALTLSRAVQWASRGAVGAEEEIERALTRAVRQRVRGGGRQRGPSGRHEESGRGERPPAQRAGREVQIERQVLAALLHQPSLMAAAKEELGPPLFTDGVCRALYQAMEAQPGAQPAALTLDEAGRALVADLLCQPPPDAAEAAASLPRWAAELRVNALQAQAEALRRQRAALPADDLEAHLALLGRIHGLERELEQARRKLVE